MTASSSRKKPNSKQPLRPPTPLHSPITPRCSRIPAGHYLPQLNPHNPPICTPTAAAMQQHQSSSPEPRAAAPCTVDRCAIGASLYGYRPSLPFSFTLVSFYSILIAASIAYAIAICRRPRRIWLPYTISIALALLLELVGYIYRIDGWQDPWGVDAFKAQLVLLAIAPGFLTTAYVITHLFSSKKNYCL